jgi:hypothetical protein
MVIEIGTVVGLLLQLNYGPGLIAPCSISLNTWKSPQPCTLLDLGPLFGTQVGPYSGEGRGLGLYPTLEQDTRTNFICLNTLWGRTNCARKEVEVTNLLAIPTHPQPLLVKSDNYNSGKQPYWWENQLYLSPFFWSLWKRGCSKGALASRQFNPSMLTIATKVVVTSTSCL